MNARVSGLIGLPVFGGHFKPTTNASTINIHDQWTREIPTSLCESNLGETP